MGVEWGGIGVRLLGKVYDERLRGTKEGYCKFDDVGGEEGGV